MSKRAVKIWIDNELFARAKAIASLEQKKLTTENGWIVEAIKEKVEKYRFSTVIKDVN